MVNRLCNRSISTSFPHSTFFFSKWIFVQEVPEVKIKGVRVVAYVMRLLNPLTSLFILPIFKIKREQWLLPV